MEAAQGQPWSANILSSQPQVTCVPITPVGLGSSKDTTDETKPRTDKGTLDHWRQLLQRQVLNPSHAPSQHVTLDNSLTNMCSLHCPHLPASSHNCPRLQPGSLCVGTLFLALRPSGWMALAGVRLQEGDKRQLPGQQALLTESSSRYSLFPLVSGSICMSLQQAQPP